MQGIVYFLIIGGLAAFRLAELIVVDDVTMGIRGFFNHPSRWRWVRESIGEIVNCVYCAGFWVSGLITICYYLKNPILDGLILFCALAGVQSVLAKLFGRNN